MVKLNFMKVKNGFFTWKQVEMAGTKIFMRASKKPVVLIKDSAREMGGVCR